MKVYMDLSIPISIPISILDEAYAMNEEYDELYPPFPEEKDSIYEYKIKERSIL